MLTQPPRLLVELDGPPTELRLAPVVCAQCKSDGQNQRSKPRRAIKSQVLADFVAEWTEAELPKEYSTYSNWIMYFDGSKMLVGLGAGGILTSPTGDTVR